MSPHKESKIPNKKASPINCEVHGSPIQPNIIKIKEDNSPLKKDKKKLYNLIYSCQYVQNEDNYLKVENQVYRQNQLNKE